MLTEKKNGFFTALEFAYHEWFLYDFDPVMWADAKDKILNTFFCRN